MFYQVTETDFQDAAKTETLNEDETIKTAKELIINLSTMDATKRREYIEKNKDSINKLSTDLTKIMDRLEEYININNNKAYRVRAKAEKNLGGEEMAKMYDRLVKKSEKEREEIRDIRSQIAAYIKEADQPTAKDIEYSSKLENKLPQVIELEKVLQMEIVEKDEKVRVFQKFKEIDGKNQEKKQVSVVVSNKYIQPGTFEVGIKGNKLIANFSHTKYGEITIEYFEKDGKLIEVDSSGSNLELFTLEKTLQKTANSKNSVVINN